MAHEFDSGMSVREMPWHGLGNVLDDYPENWEAARKAAGLDWEPITEPQFRRKLAGMTATGEPVYEYEEVPDFKYVVRSDNGAMLDSANQGFPLVTHAEMGDIVEAVLGIPGVKYETAGSLYGGKKVWALAVLAEPRRVRRDPSPYLRYLLLANAHDGSAALRLIPTSVRVVCANTWKAAEMQAEGTGQVFAFRHTKNWRDRVEEATEAIRGCYRQFDAFEDRAGELFDLKVTGAIEREFVHAFCPMPAAKIASDRVIANVEEARNKMWALLDSKTCEGIRGTAYGLVQAAGEYLDHTRKYQTLDSKFARTMLKTEPLKAQATALVLDLVKA